MSDRAQILDRHFFLLVCTTFVKLRTESDKRSQLFFDRIVFKILKQHQYFHILYYESKITNKGKSDVFVSLQEIEMCKFRNDWDTHFR